MSATGDVSIGFEGLDAAGEKPDESSYTVKFSASTPEPDANEKSEEIVLLEKNKRDSTDGEDEDKKGNLLGNEKVRSCVCMQTVKLGISSFCDCRVLLGVSRN